jgi:glutathione S-transferase
MKLFEFAPTRSIRVRWTLQELEVDFEAVTVDLRAGEHRRPAFLEVNPAGKLPALVDGEMVLTESVAIVLYLAEKYPEKGFVPADPGQRAQLNRWLLFTATELEQPLWRITRHTALYPEARRLPGEVLLAREDFIAMSQVLEKHMHDRQFSRRSLPFSHTRTRQPRCARAAAIASPARPAPAICAVRRSVILIPSFCGSIGHRSDSGGAPRD